MGALKFVSNCRSAKSREINFIHFVPALIAMTGAVISIVRADIEKREQYRIAQEITATEQLAKVVASLETNVYGDVNLIYGVAADIAGRPDINQPEFTDLSERIFNAPSQLSSITAAPDLVVNLVYPEKENRSKIGVDYSNDTEERDAVMRSIRRRSLVISGPVALPGADTALVVHYPVFTLGNGRFWGVVSATIDLGRLYKDSQVNTVRQPLEIAIAKRPFPSEKDIILGDLSTFSRTAVRNHIDLEHDTWYLAAVPKGGWIEVPPDMFSFRLTALLIALGIVGPLIWAGLLMKQRHRNLFTLKEREEQLETLSQRLNMALEASAVGVWEYEPSTNRHIWDQRMRDLYDISPETTTNPTEDWFAVVHPEDRKRALEEFSRSLRQNTRFTSEFRIIKPDGSIRHIRAHGLTYQAANGKRRVVGANWDVTRDVILNNELRTAQEKAEQQNIELRSARQTLEYQSLHDALTGLPNRRYLDRFINEQQHAPAGRTVAFIHIDLDRFKEVNDTMGHAAGDAVLKKATARMRELLGENEFAARIGGDEFVVVTSGDDPLSRAEELAEIIVESISKPIIFNGQQCRIGCSAGIACQTHDDRGLNELLVDADIALYSAKTNGRGRAEVFTDKLRSSAFRTQQLSEEFLVALEQDQFVPYFQPQFDARTLAIVGVEALARWQHPTRGLLSPAKFLGIADNLDRINDLDAIILDKSLFQAARWQALGLDIPHLAVNVSPQRLKDERLLRTFLERPPRSGAVTLELQESASAADRDDSVKGAILNLKTLGVDIAIDDFGTGHASIVNLLELDPKRLKIDRKLIAPLKASGPQHRLIKSIIEIGQSQNIEVVAEGVETTEQLEILRELGCQAVHGFALARPMTAQDFIAFARNWQADPTIVSLPSPAADDTVERKSA